MHLKLPHIHLHPKEQLHRMEKLAHTIYFALVFFEGHSMYAYAAGSLFLMCCLGAVLHEE